MSNGGPSAPVLMRHLAYREASTMAYADAVAMN